MFVYGVAKKSVLVVGLMSCLLCVAGEKYEKVAPFSIKSKDGVVATYFGPEATCFGEPQTSYRIELRNLKTGKVLGHRYFTRPVRDMEFDSTDKLVVSLEPSNVTQVIVEINK